jgi:hypothetical protein
VPPGPTALELHVAFFDPAGTGAVTMRQTRMGMRRLGVGWIWRVILPPIINGFLGTLTRRRVSFVIDVSRIAAGKHPFDSGVFDAAGQQDLAAFDALFARAGDTLTADEMDAVVSARGNRLPAMGKVAGALGHWFSRKEIRLLFCVASDAVKTVDGRALPAITKPTLRAFYDGTLFPGLARRRILVEAGCVRRGPGPAGRSKRQ